MINNIMLTGNLAANAEVKTTQSGKPLVAFRIGFNSKHGKEDYTKWVNCTWWGQYAVDYFSQRLLKGTRVLVSGKPSFRQYQDKNGNMAEAFEINVDNVEFIAKNEVRNAQPQQFNPQQYNQQMQQQPNMQQQAVANAFPGAEVTPLPYDDSVFWND